MEFRESSIDRDALVEASRRLSGLNVDDVRNICHRYNTLCCCICVVFSRENCDIVYPRVIFFEDFVRVE